MPTLNKDVTDFYQQRHYAVVGVSAGGKGFGCAAYRALKCKGYEVYPVNNKANTVLGDKCYRSLDDLPSPPDAVLVVVPAPASEDIVRDCARIGIRHVWLQQGAESAEAIRLGHELGLALVHNACVLMYLPGTGFPHNFHRFVMELVGKTPR